MNRSYTTFFIHQWKGHAQQIIDMSTDILTSVAHMRHVSARALDKLLAGSFTH